MLSLRLDIGIDAYQPISDLRERNKLSPISRLIASPSGKQLVAFAAAAAEEVYGAVFARRRSDLDEYDAAFQTQGLLRRRQIKKTDHSIGEVCACKKKGAAHKVITLNWGACSVL